MKNKIFFTALLITCIFLPLTVFAEGNCSYTAYKNCYEKKGRGNPKGIMIKALCFLRSDVSEGLLTTEDFKTCKSEARHFGQFVKIQYRDFETKKIQSAQLYN